MQKRSPEPMHDRVKLPFLFLKNRGRSKLCSAVLFNNCIQAELSHSLLRLTPYQGLFIEIYYIKIILLFEWQEGFISRNVCQDCEYVEICHRGDQ